MITQALTTFPWRRSFSVQVEMYSPGSNSRGLRSSLTSCWSRMDPRRTPGRGKRFGSVSIPYGCEAHDRAHGHEGECEEAEGERDIARHDETHVDGEDRGEVHKDLVQDEKDEAKADEADATSGVPMSVGRDRLGGLLGDES